MKTKNEYFIQFLRDDETLQLVQVKKKDSHDLFFNPAVVSWGKKNQQGGMTWYFRIDIAPIVEKKRHREIVEKKVW